MGTWEWKYTLFNKDTVYKYYRYLYLYEFRHKCKVFIQFRTFRGRPTLF